MSFDLPELNVPQWLTQQIRVRSDEDRMRVFDPLRKRWVVITPEEWVRQNMTLYIADRLQVPLNCMGNEIAIQYNGLDKRCDSIIYDSKGAPLIIIEYKRPSVQINQKTFDQIAIYNLRLNVPYLILSNGIAHFFCKIDKENHKYIFARPDEWPTYKELITNKI